MIRRKKIKICFLVFLLVFILVGCNKENSKWDFDEVEPKNINPWTYIKDVSLSSSTPIRNLAGSAGTLGVTLGITGIVFSILYMAIRILFSGSPKTREEIKQEILMKGMIAIMIFNIPFWLGIFKLIGDVLIK